MKQQYEATALFRKLQPGSFYLSAKDFDGSAPRPHLRHYLLAPKGQRCTATF